MNSLTDQKKGSLMAFVAVMFITPDSLFIRLSNVETWSLVFYRGIIPFVLVFIGMLLIYRLKFFNLLRSNGYYGFAYVLTFSVTNIAFVVSIQNTNVANTLIMIATAPMLSAILGSFFLRENPDKKTWVAIFITFFAALYIFYDSIKLGNFFGDILGFVAAMGLAVGAVIIRSAKKLNLVPSAVVGKLIIALFAMLFVNDYSLNNSDIYIVPLMCVMCVAIPIRSCYYSTQVYNSSRGKLIFLVRNYNRSYLGLAHY